MEKKRWYELVKQARKVFVHRDKFAYLYGANGETPKDKTEATNLVNTLWNMYPSHFQTSVINKGYTKDQLINHIVGKKCYDCSAFICAVSQDEEKDIYKQKVKSDHSALSMKETLVNTTTPANGVAGSVLWLEGHVALDVGNGLCIDFGNEFLDCREYEISTVNFKVSGQLPWIDYDCAINV